MKMHPLYVSVGIQYEGLSPEKGSLAALALAVVNLERDCDPLFSLVRPDKEVNNVYAGSIQDLEGYGLSRERLVRDGVDPADLMPYVVDWLDDRCWLNYQPVLVLPDAIGREYLLWYLRRYAATTDLVRLLGASDWAASQQMERFYRRHLAGSSAQDAAEGLRTELRRQQALRFQIVS